MATSQLPPGWENWCKSGIHGTGDRKVNALKKCIKDGVVRGYLSDLILEPDLDKTHPMYPSFEHLNDRTNHDDTVVEATLINHMKSHLSEEDFWKVIEHLFIVGVEKSKITPPFGEKLHEGWRPRRRSKIGARTDPSDKLGAIAFTPNPAQVTQPKSRQSLPVQPKKAAPKMGKATAPLPSKPARLLPQNITFSTIGLRPVGETFTLSAAASSKLPIAYTIDGPAFLDGDKVTVTGAGIVTVNASQPGDPVYAPAVTVSKRFTTGAKQIIEFTPIPAKTLDDPPFILEAKSNVGLEVTFSLISGPATLSGDVATLNGIGTVKVQAQQAGNDVYAPTLYKRSFSVKAALITRTGPVPIPPLTK